jgi:hypothetical protein
MTGFGVSDYDESARKLTTLVVGVCQQEVDRLTETERSALPYVLPSIEAVFLGYFLRSNDKAGVEQNTLALEWLYDHISLVRRVLSQT